MVYLNTAKQIWDDLAARYSQSNVPRLFHLKKDLSSLTQGTKSITTYFTMYRSLVDELDNLSPIPKCICVNSNCACGNNQNLDNYEKLNKLSQFLMGLNDQFTVVRGQILLMNPVPDISQAYYMLLQEENQREFTTHNSIVSENTAVNVKLYANTENKPKPARKVLDHNLFCDYYKLTGHIKEKCLVYMATRIGIGFMVNPSQKSDKTIENQVLMQP